MKRRAAYIDNMKAVLMILVVFGHLLERVPFSGNKAIYLVIYSFHMPAFVFISGLCYKKGVNWIKKFGIPYLVFQTIYLLYEAYEKGKPIQLEYTKPVWVLWYLMSMILWYAVCHCLCSEKRKGILILAGSILVSLLIGYEKTVGYYFSLSRTIVLFPFFWSGVLIRENKMEAFERFIHTWDKKNVWIKITTISLSVLSVYLLLDMQGALKKTWFYQSIPYNTKGYTILIRCLVLFMAAELTTCMLIFIPKCELPFFSRIGENTLPIFILHGILIKYLAHVGMLKFETNALLYTSCLTLLIVVVLSTPVAVTVCNVIANPFSLKKSIRKKVA